MITATTFDGKFQKAQIGAKDVKRLINSHKLVWINCASLSHGELKSVFEGVESIPHFLVDYCTRRQRPRIDQHGDTVFLVFDMLSYEHSLRNEQLNAIVGGNFVLTITGKNLRQIDRIEELAGTNSAHIRKLGKAYLLYLILDSIVDDYGLILDKIDEDMERLEASLLEGSKENMHHKIIQMGKIMAKIWRSIMPEKEIFHSLGRSEFNMLGGHAAVYFRDTASDLLTISERIEMQRETISNLMEVYASSISNSLSTIMKMLTVLTAVLLVPTLISGIYGMNLAYLPIANHPNGFLVMIIIMIISMLLLLLAFRLKKWI
ncbi:MAG: magnesium/cobalt transporter CorA [Candidatus Aenigmarchaeota archaeon]|nr:magnesium/cobalt transporter CorA [Candidatus Aenigmarchaeota archaeon]